MKRIIVWLLVLVGAWQLIQLPSVNSMLFAFLTLGINPLTNRPLSTPSLLSLLIVGAICAILLFFSRELSDIFGGMYDWLLRPAQDVDLNAEAKPVVHSLPDYIAPVELTMTIAASKTLEQDTVTALTKSLPSLPHLPLPDFRPLITRFEDWYRHLLVSARAQLQALKQPPIKGIPKVPSVVAQPRVRRSPKVSLPTPAIHVPSIPVRIFGQRLHGVLSRQWRAASMQSTVLGHATSRQAHLAQDHLKAGAHRTELGVARAAEATGKFIYRMALLGALGLLLAVGTVLHGLQRTITAIGHATVRAYRRLCRAMVLSAISVTLGMFAIGRAVAATFRIIGRGIVAIGRAVARCVALLVVATLLAAGYCLFIFSLLSFMVWELFEPYVRRTDKWLEHTVSEREGLAEVGKITHEMARTFVQWYRELRDLKHGIYR